MASPTVQTGETGNARKGRKSRAPPPTLEEVEAGLLVVSRWDLRKVKLMKKPLLVEICRQKFGDAEAYDQLTVADIISRLVRSPKSFFRVSVPYYLPKEPPREISQGSISLLSRQASFTLDSPGVPRQGDPDPAVQQAIDAIISFGTSRTKLKSIPRSTLLSACSSFQIGTEDETFSSLKKPEILSRIRDWVCISGLSGMTYPPTAPRSGDTAPGASPIPVIVQR